MWQEKQQRLIRKQLRVMVLASFFIINSANIFAQDHPGWLTIEGNVFLKDKKPFKFIGANAVNLVFYDDWDLDVRQALMQAKENNISVLRLYLNWGWSKDADFDKIIDYAGRNNIQLILVLTDCCCSSDYSNPEKYFQVHAPFCDITNEQNLKAFKQFIKRTILRKNSVNHRVYRDDPTILAWEIANELEYWRFTESQVRKWIEEVSKYVKLLDRHHPVTVGVSSDNLDQISLGSLSSMFSLPTLDFVSFHFYPPFSKTDFSENIPRENAQRIALIVRKLLSLGKPVVMAEFGFSNSVEFNDKIRQDSNQADLYTLHFKIYMDQAFEAGSCGVMFWGWGIPEARRVPMWWNREDHNVVNKKFCDFIKNYKIPKINEKE